MPRTRLSEEDVEQLIQRLTPLAPNVLGPLRENMLIELVRTIGRYSMTHVILLPAGKLLMVAGNEHVTGLGCGDPACTDCTFHPRTDLE